jgi:hypothetical protein
MAIFRPYKKYFLLNCEGSEYFDKVNSNTWFQKVSIRTKNSGADPFTLYSLQKGQPFAKRALDEWILGSRKIKMQDSQKSSQDAQSGNDGKWIQPAMSTTTGSRIWYS